MRDQPSETAEPVTTEQDRVTPGRHAAVPAGERCTNCQAPLASDQRYCVNCGERRGRSRFAAASFAPAPAPAPSPASPPRRPRASSGATLVAGVATLLVALGVGVLIGHDAGNNSTPRPVAASAPQIIQVGNGGSAGGTGGGQSKSKGKKSKSKKAKSAHVTTKVAKKATAAASKVLGGSKSLAPVTVQPGGACTSGQAGCQNGKFTGNFFGGG